MLLPFDGLPVSEDPHTRDKPRPVQPKLSSEESDWSTSDSSSSDESYEEARQQVKQNPNHLMSFPNVAERRQLADV